MTIITILALLGVAVASFYFGREVGREEGVAAFAQFQLDMLKDAMAEVESVFEQVTADAASGDTAPEV